MLIFPTSQTLYIGIAVAEGAGGTVDVGFASHDGTYSIDFAVQTLGGNGASVPASGIGTPGLSGAQTPTGIASGTHTPLPLEERPAVLADYFVDKIRNYQQEHRYKFVGAGLTRKVVQMSPQLPARLWWELDIVPLVFDKPLEDPLAQTGRHGIMFVDEEADSMARKCLMFVVVFPKLNRIQKLIISGSLDQANNPAYKSDFAIRWRLTLQAMDRSHV